MTPAGRGGLGASSGRRRARGCPDDSAQGSSGVTSEIPPVFFIKGSAIARFSAAQPLPRRARCGAAGSAGLAETGAGLGESGQSRGCGALRPDLWWFFVVVVTIIIVYLVIIFKP